MTQDNTQASATEAPSLDAAYEMGATGGPTVEAERLAFEAWMRGHCWALCATWDGKGYRSDAEQGGALDPWAMATRRLWAAWRDRAALASQGAASQLPNPGSPEASAMMDSVLAEYNNPSNPKNAARAGWVAAMRCLATPHPEPSTPAAQEPIQALIAAHAALLEANPFAYFELAHTRATGWMAWITDKPAQGEPGTAAYAQSRKVIACGQGDTPEAACADALAAMKGATAP